VFRCATFTLRNRRVHLAGRPCTRDARTGPLGASRMYPLKLRVAICAICDGPIHVQVADPRDATSRSSLQADIQAATEAHQRRHSRAAMLAYQDDQDTRATYTLRETLGTASMYRLWLEARRCPDPACRRETGG
jgi:hypothetical protein